MTQSNKPRAGSAMQPMRSDTGLGVVLDFVESGIAIA
jgi:hypothetical protein